MLVLDPCVNDSYCVSVTHYESPSKVVAARIRSLRGSRSWSAERLAQECADRGFVNVNRSVIANIENGRRSAVTIDECIALALALDVALVDLITPNGVEHTIEPVPGTTVDVGDYREWMTGMNPFPGVDGEHYWTQPWSGAERDYQRLGEYIAARGGSTGGAPRHE